MSWYKVIEFNSENWDDTSIILERFNGVHYSTHFLDKNRYRKFVVYLTDPDLIITRLSLSNKVSIDVFDKNEYEQLRALGYIKDDKKS